MPDLDFFAVRILFPNAASRRNVKTLVFGILSIQLMFVFRSTVSNNINMSFIEHRNGTDRNQDARK
jgi:hypothetical protein